MNQDTCRYRAKILIDNVVLREKMITHYLLEAIDWLNPIVHIVGIIVAMWAFRKCGKKGYLIIAAYFVLATFTIIAMPKINRVTAAKRTPTLSEQTEQRLNQEIQAVYDRVFEEEGTPPMASTRKINFPLGPILLVVGLWLVVKNEKEQKSFHSNADPAGSK